MPVEYIKLFKGFLEADLHVVVPNFLSFLLIESLAVVFGETGVEGGTEANN
jgi:hypothetical protein